MSGLIDYATAVLGASERRLELASQNIANISTPGYQRFISFSKTLEARSSSISPYSGMDAWKDDRQGKMTLTGNPLDLAISGRGYFQIREGERLSYTRAGQFSRAADGTVVNASGGVLQQAGGGDLVIDRSQVDIDQDGAVLVDGLPVARIALFIPDDDSVPVDPSTADLSTSPMSEMPDGQMRQGMIENSNVSIADEMVTTMSAMRQAETGARLVQVYDELMGRVVTTLGQGGR